MKKKLGVSLVGLQPEMRFVMQVVDAIYKEETGREATITSGTEWHRRKGGSWHPFGLALDFRTRDLTVAQLGKVFDAIKLRLDLRSPRYDVVLEKTHIHIEYDKVVET